MESRESGGKQSGHGMGMSKVPPELPVLRPPQKPRRLTNQLQFWKTQIQNIWNHESAVPFHAPVKPEHAPGYYEEVQHPMDLTTIWQRLVKDYYSSAKELEYDFRLMLQNCFMYNTPGDPVHMDGKMIENVFMELLKQMPEVEEEIEQKEWNRAPGRKPKKKAASKRRDSGSSGLGSGIIAPLIAPLSNTVSSALMPLAIAVSENERKVEVLPAATSSFVTGTGGTLSTNVICPWLPPYVNNSAGSLWMVPTTAIEAFQPTVRAAETATSLKKCAVPWKSAGSSDCMAYGFEYHRVPGVAASPTSSSVVVAVAGYCYIHIGGSQDAAELEKPSSVKACEKLLKELRGEHPALFVAFWDADSFSKAEDSTERVKNPMDLSRIQAKMNNREYRTAAKFEKDMRLMFTNFLKTHYVKDLNSLKEDHIVRRANELRFHFDCKFSKIPEDEPEVHVRQSHYDSSDDADHGSKHFLKKALLKMDEARTYSALAVEAHRGAKKKLRKKQPQTRPRPMRKIQSSPHQSVSTTTPDDAVLAKDAKKVVKNSNRKSNAPARKKQRSEGKAVQKPGVGSKISRAAVAPSGEQVSAMQIVPGDEASAQPLTFAENRQLESDIENLKVSPRYEKMVVDLVWPENSLPEEGEVFLNLDTLPPSTARLLQSKVKSWLNERLTSSPASASSKSSSSSCSSMSSESESE